MKKVVFTLLLLATVFAASAQNRNLERLAGEEGISYVYVSKAMLGLIAGQGSNANVNGVDVSGLADKLNSLQVVSADKPEAIRRVRNAAEVMPKAHMEVLMQVVESGSRTEFFTLKQGELITDLLMLSDSGDSYTLLLIQGRFTSRDIQGITASAGK
jgi:hypothetical protein